MQFRKQIYFILVCIFITGCSVKKNTWVSRNYHTLTSYYNVYYNGNQAFLDGHKLIRDGAKNDYTTLLPIYFESDRELTKKADSEMDRAIEKSKKLIDKHSIKVKPKRQSGNRSESYKSFMKKTEYNPMVDDAWLLMGKAHATKHENLEAINTLEFLNREYEGAPSRYESMLWLSKSYIDMEQYTNAQAALESYDLDGNAPDKLYGSYMAAYANLLITQGKYAEALPYMENAARNTSKRWMRFRYNYILAQLYQMLDKHDEAAKTYRLVAKNNPDYEMSFNARINMAGVVKGSSNAAETEKALNKLMRDKKNSDYLDQIYYALGNLKNNQGEQQKAISNYRLSIDKSSMNDRQKGLSFLAMGNIYYSKPLYIEAFESYDSAVVLLSDRHPEFDEVTLRHHNLEKLSVQLRKIRQEDSLLFLAQLPESERMDRINKILEQQKQALDKKQAASQTPFYDSNIFNDASNQSQTTTQQGSKWYFYNVSVAGAGKLEFERRWGKRRNEDSWRRSVKSSVSADEPFQEPGMDFDNGSKTQQADGTTKAAVGDSTKQEVVQSQGAATKESLLSAIPLTDQAKQNSHKILEESLFESAGLLYNQVHDYMSASKYYERLLLDYPRSAHRPDILIGLYQSYEKLSDQTQMARVRDMIISENPDSKFARYLTDSQFFAKIESQRVDIEKHYEATYVRYLMNDYGGAIAGEQEMPSREENPYIAKYRLIKALSYAKMGESDPFHQTLKTIVNDYSGTEEAKLASILIGEIEKGRQPIKATPYRSKMTELSEAASTDASAGSQADVSFVYSPYEAHSAIVVSDSATNIGLLQYNLADYNFGRFLLADYEIEQQLLPDQTKILLVKGLKNKSEALDYLYTVREQIRLFADAGLNDPQMIVVSENNIKNLILSGNMAAYLKFFKDYYLSVVKEPAKSDIVKESVIPKEKAATVEKVAVSAEPVNVEVPEPAAVTQQSVAETDLEKEKPQDVAESRPTSASIAEPAAQASSIYKNDDGTAYSVVILIRKSRIDLRRIQSIITNYTINNFGEELQGEASDWGTTHRMIKITGFKDSQAAQDYYQKFTSSSMMMNNFPGSNHHFMVINETNYQILLESKDVEGYKSFIGQQK